MKSLNYVIDITEIILPNVIYKGPRLWIAGKKKTSLENVKVVAIANRPSLKLIGSNEYQ